MYHGNSITLDIELYFELYVVILYNNDVISRSTELYRRDNWTLSSQDDNGEETKKRGNQETNGEKMN